MLIVVMIINVISLFFLVCGLNTVRLRYNIAITTLRERVYYQSVFLLLNLLSFLLCLSYWRSIGCLIWINLTSINAFLTALILGFFPQIYIAWIYFTKK